MDPEIAKEAAQQGVNWTLVLIALIANGALIIGAIVQGARVLLEIQRNTLITKYGPTAAAEKVIEGLKNGAGDHIAQKTASAVKVDADAAAEKIIEVAKAAGSGESTEPNSLAAYEKGYSKAIIDIHNKFEARMDKSDGALKSHMEAYATDLKEIKQSLAVLANAR